MERSEPALVPEWLKSTGSSNSGSGNANHHHSATSSSSHSDNYATTQSTRNRSSVSIGEYDSPRPHTHLERTSLPYFNRSSSINGSMMHEKESGGYTRSYSSSGRSYRDRDWDKDLLNFSNKERSALDDDRNHSLSTPLGLSANAWINSIDKDPLRRSRSLISGKRGDGWSRRLAVDVNSSNNKSNHSNNSYSAVGGSINGSIKTVFEKDFPSLGAEERQGALEIPRFSSPGLSSAAQCLPTGSSAVIGGDGWTSALAEVPVIIGNNSMGSSSAQQTSSAAVAPTTTGGLNMAETLAQAPARTRTLPQLYVETQRLEELAIKQSRQLIPMTPLMPKTSVLNSEKPKSKAGIRMETSSTSKVGHRNLSTSNHANASLQVGHTRSDVAKTSHVGKLQVLKPGREKNGSLPSNKNSMSPTKAVGMTNNSLVNPSTPTYASVRSPNNSKLNATTDHKTSVIAISHSSSMEKRPTLSQVQSRNDFFNLMRKKTSTNLSSGAPDPSPVLEHSGEPITEPVVMPQVRVARPSEPSCVDWATENGATLAANGDTCEDCQMCPNNGDKHSNAIEVVYSDEREIAFLRSLGWEENSEEEGLTEEEINAFYEEHVHLKSSSKLCQAIQEQKLRSHEGSLDGTSSGLSSSEPESDA